VRRSGTDLRAPSSSFYLAAGGKNVPEDIKRRYPSSVFQHRPHFGVGLQIEKDGGQKDKERENFFVPHC